MINNKENAENDLILFYKIQNDDRKAFEFVFRKYYVQMVAFANSYLHDMDNAENVVQNTFVKLWMNRKKYEIKTLKNYLLVAIRNGCQNELKKNQHRILYENTLKSDDLILQTNISDYKVMDQIKMVIDQLPEQRKKIFKLNRLEGLKYKEIADTLNISTKTVEVQMGKALKFLRTQLIDLKNQVYSILF